MIESKYEDMKSFPRETILEAIIFGLGRMSSCLEVSHEKWMRFGFFLSEIKEKNPEFNPQSFLSLWTAHGIIVPLERRGKYFFDLGAKIHSEDGWRHCSPIWLEEYYDFQESGNAERRNLNHQDNLPF